MSPDLGPEFDEIVLKLIKEDTINEYASDTMTSKKSKDSDLISVKGSSESDVPDLEIAPDILVISKSTALADPILGKRAM